MNVNKACDITREHLDAYMDNELAPDLRQDVSTHLLSCADCQSELETSQRLKKRTRDAVLQIAIPEHLPSRINAAIGQSRQHDGVGRSRLWLATAAAIAALAFVVWKASTSDNSSQQLAGVLKIGVADHVDCAVPRDYSQLPPSPAVMDSDMGPKFKDLLPILRAQVPPDYRLEQAHRCMVAGRQYVHLIFRNAPELISVIATRKLQGESFGSPNIAPAFTAARHEKVYQSKVDVYEAAGAEAGDYLWFVVSNLDAQKNQQMAQRVADPLDSFLRNQNAVARVPFLGLDQVAFLW